MEFTTIKLSICEGIATLTLNRPKALNAMSSVMMKELNEALDACAADEKVRAVVIAGEGKAFCAGGDVKEMMAGIMTGDFGLFKVALDESKAVIMKIRGLLKPVIASVRGSAAGAGFSVALACDFCIASDDSQYIQSFAQVGLIPDMGGLYFLTKSLGYKRATDLCMTAKVVTAEEAFALGLVNKIVPADTLEAETIAMAKKLATGPGVSYAKIKDMINKVEMAELEAHLDLVTEYQMFCSDTEDFGKGVMAFVEKTPPKFKGR